MSGVVSNDMRHTLVFLWILLLPLQSSAYVCEIAGGKQAFMEAELVVIAEVVSVTRPRILDALYLTSDVVKHVGIDHWSFVKGATELLGVGPARADLRVLEVLVGQAPKSITVEYQNLSACCAQPFFPPGERVLVFLRREGHFWNRRWVTAGGADGVVWIYDTASTRQMAQAVESGLSLLAGEGSGHWRPWVLERASDPATRRLGLRHLPPVLQTEEQARLAVAYRASPTVADAERMLESLRDHADPWLDEMALDLAAAAIESENALVRDRFLRLAERRIDYLGTSVGYQGAPRDTLREALNELLDKTGHQADANRFRPQLEQYAGRLAAIMARFEDF